MVKPSVTSRPNLLLERIMAITAAVNLGLVAFDLSYIPWRDFYLRNLPVLTTIYDPIKGIERHRETEAYRERVRTLGEQIAQTGLDSPQVAQMLEVLNKESEDLIDSNPFTAADKAGTLEKIKNRVRDRTREKSAKLAFRRFWSVDYLQKQGWMKEYEFYKRRVDPLIATSYFRHINENGDPIDLFWLIDLPFVIIFACELLTRSYFVRRKYSYSWLEAFLWRWYDWFLLLPLFRWSRVITVAIRLDKAHLVDFYPIRKLVHQGVVANFAEELTEIVIVRVINQTQSAIQRGEITKWLVQQGQQGNSSYIDINEVNEIEAITKIFIQAIIYQVLPQIQPELIAIFSHSINTALATSPIYRNLQNLPGVSNLQTQINEQLATQIATNLYQAIVTSVEDPIAAKLGSQLLERFTSSLGQEMQKQHVTTELQNLIYEFLEEIKINYIQRFSQEDIDAIIEQTRKLRTSHTVTTTPTTSNLVRKTGSRL